VTAEFGEPWTLAGADTTAPELTMLTGDGEVLGQLHRPEAIRAMLCVNACIGLDNNQLSTLGRTAVLALADERRARHRARR
jgi:hypothetical protein